MNEGQFLKEFIHRNKIKATRIVEMADIKRATIYTHYNKQKLDSDVKQKYSDAIGIDWNSENGNNSVSDNRHKPYKIESNATFLGNILDDDNTEDVGFTKFREISPGRYRMVVRIVPEYAHAGYLTGYSDPEYYNELPMHEITVKVYHRGKYQAFEVAGDSMNDGSIESIPDETIVTGREIPQDNWKSKLHSHKWPNFVFVHKTEGILVKRITKQNLENGILTLHSLNPNKEEFPDFDININDLFQIFNVVKRELP